MKSIADIYESQVQQAAKVDEKLAKIFLSSAMKKFTMNCLMIAESEFKRPVPAAFVPYIASDDETIMRASLEFSDDIRTQAEFRVHVKFMANYLKS